MNMNKVDNVNIKPQDEGDLEAGDLPRDVRGLGNLLYHIHSTFFLLPLFCKWTTSLQFYEHVVVATIERKLWCFPKKFRIEVIPRFKIVDAEFSLGPRGMPWGTGLIFTTSLILIIVGASGGGCSEESGSYYGYSYSSGKNSAACSSLAIGCLLLIPVILLIVYWFVSKNHYVYLQVKSPHPSSAWFSFGGSYRHTYRFKKIGFDDHVHNRVTFDEFYLIEYVFGSLGRAGNVVTDEAHLISHFHHAALATPIVPIHADSTIRDLMGTVTKQGGVKNDLRGSGTNNFRQMEPSPVRSVPQPGLKHRRNHQHAASMPPNVHAAQHVASDVHAAQPVACEL